MSASFCRSPRSAVSRLSTQSCKLGFNPLLLSFCRPLYAPAAPESLSFRRSSCQPATARFTSHPSHVLGLIWAFQWPTVILLYSRYRKDQERCSYWKAVGRGLLGLPVGAVANALGAIALGAPVGIQYICAL